MAVGTPGHQVPGAIHPRPRRPERACHKPRPGQPRPPPIPKPHSMTRYIQVPDNANGHRSQPRIEHEKSEMGQWHPDRADSAVDVVPDDFSERGMHRRLGCAIQIEQARQTRVIVPPRLKALWLQRFTGEHHSLKLELTSQLGLERISRLQLVKRGRGLTQDGDVFCDEQGVKVGWRARHRFGHHHQSPTAQEGSPDLADRDVESQGMPLRPHLPGRLVRHPTLRAVARRCGG